MKLRFDKQLVLAAVSLVLAATAQAGAGSTREHHREHVVKAAVVYNFIKFTEWPEERVSDGNEIVVGILGDDDFASAFDPVKDKLIREKKLVVRYLGKWAELPRDPNDQQKVSDESRKALSACHVLFVCKSEEEYMGEILKTVHGKGILTIGETTGLLEAGGIINFIPKAPKPIFEINLIVAEEAGLKISSRMLRLAQRVITDESAEDQ